MKGSRDWCGVCRLGSIGDNLIASSCLPLLARDYRIEMITAEPAGVIFENNPWIDKLTIKKTDDIPPCSSDDWTKWFELRSREYAKFVHLTNTCEVTLATVRNQAAFWWPASVRRRLCAQNYLELVHDVAEVPYDFEHGPRFYPTEAERERALATKAKIGERVIGWAVSGSRLDKLYPYSEAVIARLIKETNTPVVLFGAPGRDYEIAKEIVARVKAQNGTSEGVEIAISQPVDQQQQWTVVEGELHTQVKPAEPRWPIRRSLAQIQTCDLVIGPDTGLLWACAMEDMPKISLVSHASAENITKHWRNTVTAHADPERVSCWPCHRLHETIDTCRKTEGVDAAACMADISADAVVASARYLLGDQSVRLLAAAE